MGAPNTAYYQNDSYSLFNKDAAALEGVKFPVLATAYPTIEAFKQLFCVDEVILKFDVKDELANVDTVLVAAVYLGGENYTMHKADKMSKYRLMDRPGHKLIILNDGGLNLRAMVDSVVPVLEGTGVFVNIIAPPYNAPTYVKLWCRGTDGEGTGVGTFVEVGEIEVTATGMQQAYFDRENFDIPEGIECEWYASAVNSEGVKYSGYYIFAVQADSEKEEVRVSFSFITVSDSDDDYFEVGFITDVEVEGDLFIYFTVGQGSYSATIYAHSSIGVAYNVIRPTDAGTAHINGIDGGNTVSQEYIVDVGAMYYPAKDGGANNIIAWNHEGLTCSGPSTTGYNMAVKNGSIYCYAYISGDNIVDTGMSVGNLEVSYYDGTSCTPYKFIGGVLQP